MRAGDVVDGQVTQRRKHVCLENAPNLFQARLPSFLQRQPAMGQPQVVDGFEGVFACQNDGVALALALGVRVDALGERRTGLVAPITRLLQGQRRIAAEGHAPALAVPRVAEVPGLGADGGHVKVEAIEVGQ